MEQLEENKLKLYGCNFIFETEGDSQDQKEIVSIGWNLVYQAKELPCICIANIIDAICNKPCIYIENFLNQHFATSYRKSQEICYCQNQKLSSFCTVQGKKTVLLWMLFARTFIVACLCIVFGFLFGFGTIETRYGIIVSLSIIFVNACLGNVADFLKEWIWTETTLEQVHTD